jgi:hypothetical protein
MTGASAGPICPGLTWSQRQALTERLAEAYAGRHARAVVESEVARAEQELRGQVPAGAREELLHRLADCRLRTSRPARP